MPKYVLPSSRKIFVKEGKINLKVLSRLVREAYKKKGLYAECEIQVKRKENSDSEIRRYYTYVTYKELWDCYRNLFGKEDFHPYDKIHPFSLSMAFVRAQNNNLLWHFLLESTVGKSREEGVKV